MNTNELKAEMQRKGISIPELAKKMKMSKKTLYSRFNGETSFKQDEISLISKTLNLTSDKILFIFFADMVS